MRQHNALEVSQEDATWTVGEFARASGVSVRSLHHYDEVGLLRPASRSEAGYRLYSRRDLLRLQEILVHRALGMSLAQIGAILDDPRHDRVAALYATRETLAREARRVERVLTAIDAAIKAEEEGHVLPVEEMFGEFDVASLVSEGDVH